MIDLRLKLLHSATFQLARCQLLKFLCQEEWVRICGSLASVVYLQFSFFALKLLWWKRWGIHKTLIYNDTAVSFGLRAFIHHPIWLKLGMTNSHKLHTCIEFSLYGLATIFDLKYWPLVWKQAISSNCMKNLSGGVGIHVIPLSRIIHYTYLHEDSAFLIIRRHLLQFGLVCQGSTSIVFVFYFRERLQ